MVPLLLLMLSMAGTPYEDRVFSSKVFGQERHYRLFLPAGYAASGQRYPVIYYFHGHSDRYTLERYDDGKDTVPKIAKFVAEHPVIVVAVDGYVAEHYTGFYGGAPYDVMADGGTYDFGVYFQELVAHIDGSLRTMAGRRYRATSGLSMGGFMSLYLSARYPELIGSASAFNPGPEFYMGAKGERVLWRPKDHVASHKQTMVRLIRASGDYISQYHEETRMAYARARAVDFEFRQDEYHRHWATSIGETFAFHERAFANPKLGNTPETFDTDNAYRKFGAWGWEFEAVGGGAGYTVLRDVRQGGLRVETRRWAPDGGPVAGRTVRVSTAGLYKAGVEYTVLDAPLNDAAGSGAARRIAVKASADGRLRFEVEGSGRQVSIHGPGAGGQAPVVLPMGRGAVLRVMPDADMAVPVRIYNPRLEAMKDVVVEVSSEYPIVSLAETKTRVGEIPAGGFVDLSKVFRGRFTSGGGDYWPARITVRTACGQVGRTEDVDVLVAPDGMTAPAAMEILDGRTMTFRVFKQKGNQGGGSAIERKVTEGKGNGNGVLEPGEEATVWVQTKQGLDPFDKGTWHRARVYTAAAWLEEAERLEEQKGLEWTGAKELTSVVRVKGDAPLGSEAEAVLW
ncbi:MAG: hypothetical protein HY821_21690, partial [Acidobacteria bacterium]|nr:hypothetical protein [Acidobacteriota bacterium]